MVRSPELRRPPVRCFTASSGLYGLSVVMSSFTSEVLNLSVGVIGRYVLIGIVSSLYPRAALRPRPKLIPCPWPLEVVHLLRHLLAGLQAHKRLLPVRTIARVFPSAALL